MIAVLHWRLLKGMRGSSMPGKLGEKADELPSVVAGRKGVSGFDEAGRELDIAGGVVGGEVGEGARKTGSSG